MTESQSDPPHVIEDISEDDEGWWCEWACGPFPDREDAQDAIADHLQAVGS